MSLIPLDRASGKSPATFCLFEASPVSSLYQSPSFFCHEASKFNSQLRKGLATPSVIRPSSWRSNVVATAAPSKEAVSSKEALPPSPPNKLLQLYEQEGQSPWIDNLARGWTRGGHLAELVHRGIRGITSNPTTFQKAIGETDDYDEEFRHLMSTDNTADVEAAYWSMAIKDVVEAADIMRPLHDSSGGSDYFVSLEVSPALAHDTAATEEAAREIQARVDRPNLFVKIPATSEGVPAVQRMIGEGISINVTLIFSLTRYEQVIDAYMAGLEHYFAANSPDSTPASSPPSLPPTSVASFFVSRVDLSVDSRLNTIGSPQALELRGKAAVAQAVLAYQLFLRKFGSERWRALEAKGATPQRPLWASTGVKDPAYPDTLYVDSLIGPGTVNTLPAGTMLAFAGHGAVHRTVDADVEGAMHVMAQLAELGVDLEEVAQELEADGVKKFLDSYTGLLDTLSEKAMALRV